MLLGLHPAPFACAWGYSRLPIPPLLDIITKRPFQNEETSNSNKALVLENIMKLDLKEVGNKIKERRVRKKLRQTALSAELKITQMHVSNIENGKTGISFEVLMQLREKLDCDLEDLLVAHFK